MAYLFDLVPGILPLLDLSLGLRQLPKETGHIGAAGASCRGGEAAEHWRRAGRVAATHKVPYAARSPIQT